MAYTTINDPSVYFQNKLYTGNGSTAHDITNTGNSNLQPDLIYIKNRSGSSDPIIQDTNRGINVQSFTNGTAAENTNASWGHVNSVAADGFQVDAGSPTSEANANKNNDNYVAWQWKANGGTTASNSDGSITSTVQANTTAGFSIITYAGNGSNNATIGHGLSATPQLIFTKNRGAAYNWVTYSAELASTKVLVLDMNLAEFTPSGGYYSNVGSSTYQLVQGSSGLTNVNANGNNYVAYCFAEKQGYSKMGSYKGNGSSDGAFVYTGFKPALVIFKSINNAKDWYIFDNKRNTFNVMNKILHPNKADAESTSTVFDFLSNGFKFRDSDNAWNGNGDTYLYMAFAQNPLVASNNVLALAR